MPDQIPLNLDAPAKRTRKESMPALEIEILDDGTIRLEQSEGYGETDPIHLHPIQLRFVAEKAGLLDPQQPKMPPGLEKRLRRILDSAELLRMFLAAVPSFPPRDEEDEDVALARRLEESLQDLLDDYFPAPDPSPKGGIGASHDEL